MITPRQATLVPPGASAAWAAPAHLRALRRLQFLVHYGPAYMKPMVVAPTYNSGCPRADAIAADLAAADCAHEAAIKPAASSAIASTFGSANAGFESAIHRGTTAKFRQASSQLMSGRPSFSWQQFLLDHVERKQHRFSVSSLAAHGRRGTIPAYARQTAPSIHWLGRLLDAMRRASASQCSSPGVVDTTCRTSTKTDAARLRVGHAGA